MGDRLLVSYWHTTRKLVMKVADRSERAIMVVAIVHFGDATDFNSG